MSRTVALVSALAVTGLTAQPSHAAQGVGESTWSDAPGSPTLVVESACGGVPGPSPYNFRCTWTAVADNTLDASPRRGMCTESLATVGPRTIAGPCAARFSVTMRVHPVVTQGVATCNGTSLNQQTEGSEPRQVKGNFEYESTEGLFRTVSADVNVTDNVVSFDGSLLSAGQDRLVDEVHGTFTVRCANGARSDGAWRGDYSYLTS